MNIIWIQFYGPLVGFYGLLKVTLLTISKAQIVIEPVLWTSVRLLWPYLTYLAEHKQHPDEIGRSIFYIHYHPLRW